MSLQKKVVSAVTTTYQSISSLRIVGGIFFHRGGSCNRDVPCNPQRVILRETFLETLMIPVAVARFPFEMPPLSEERSALKAVFPDAKVGISRNDIYKYRRYTIPNYSQEARRKAEKALGFWGSWTCIGTDSRGFSKGVALEVRIRSGIFPTVRKKLESLGVHFSQQGLTLGFPVDSKTRGVLSLNQGHDLSDNPSFYTLELFCPEDEEEDVFLEIPADADEVLISELVGFAVSGASPADLEKFLES